MNEFCNVINKWAYGPISPLHVYLHDILLFVYNNNNFTCIQDMKLVTNKFKSGGLYEKRVVATWNLGNHLSICF